MSSGYITSYIQQSDGTFDGTLNTLDSSGGSTTITLTNVNLIINNWCLTSLNNNDQLLIMTNDSKYIYIPSIPFMMSDANNTLYKSLINVCIDLYQIGTTDNFILNTFNIGISTPVSNNLPKSLKNAAQLVMYMYIYFFINNGIGSYLAISNISSMFKNKTLPDLNTNDPNYNTWNQLSSDNNLSSFLKRIYLIYAISINYKSYFQNETLPIDVYDSDWKYFGNFYKTIYDLYSFDASNFCINLSANINYISNVLSYSPSSSASTPFPFSSPTSTSTLYIPECIDCRVISDNATSNINALPSLCNTPTPSKKVSFNTLITYTPAQIQDMNYNFLFFAFIFVIILIIIAVLYWYFNKNNESNNTENKYYYV
jgi:cbb3-type cytochrome oxidase subunit 3